MPIVSDQTFIAGIPLVLGGLVLGLVPGIPHVQLNPDLVLLVFLPPLLYSSAFFVDLRSLREDARVIALSAIAIALGGEPLPVTLTPSRAGRSSS